MALIAVATSKTDWYFMRGSGLVAFILLTMTVMLGVAGANGGRSRRVSPAVTAGVHRSIALLAAAFVALHVVTAVLDSWIGMRWADAVVPFTSSFRPAWIGLGALSVDCMIAVIATSLLRDRLDYRTWRMVHWLTWLSWPVAYLHAIGTGTDATHGWGLAVTTSCAAAFVAAGVWRLAPAKRRVAAVTVTGVGVGVGVGGRTVLSRAALEAAPALAPEIAALGRPSGTRTR